jgi:PhnB protein
VPLEDGSIGHAEIRVGDTVLLAFDQRPDWPDMPSLLRIFVADADATMTRAVAAGARVVTQPQTHAFGQRGGRVRDPFGTIWWISAVVEDVTPDEVMRRLTEPAYAEAMREPQETLDRELSGRNHATASPPTDYERLAPRSRGLRTTSRQWTDPEPLVRPLALLPNLRCAWAIARCIPCYARIPRASPRRHPRVFPGLASLGVAPGYAPVRK